MGALTQEAYVAWLEQMVLKAAQVLGENNLVLYVPGCAFRHLFIEVPVETAHRLHPLRGHRFTSREGRAFVPAGRAGEPYVQRTFPDGPSLLRQTAETIAEHPLATLEEANAYFDAKREKETV